MVSSVFMRCQSNCDSSLRTITKFGPISSSSSTKELHGLIKINLHIICKLDRLMVDQQCLLGEWNALAFQQSLATSRTFVGVEVEWSAAAEVAKSLRPLMAGPSLDDLGLGSETLSGSSRRLEAGLGGRLACIRTSIWSMHSRRYPYTRKVKQFFEWNLKEYLLSFTWHR